MSETKYRTGVSALIINKDNELLLVNLESFEERYFAVPGGGLESNETLEAAAYREMAEELGIVPESLSMVGKSTNPVKFLFKNKILSRDGSEYQGQERYFFGFRFIGDLSGIKPRAGEVRSFRWVQMSDLKDYLLFENQFLETAEKITEIFPTLTQPETE